MKKRRLNKQLILLFCTALLSKAAQAAPAKSSAVYLAEIKNTYNQLQVATIASGAMNLLNGPKMQELQPMVLDKQAQSFEAQKNHFKAACLYLVEADRLTIKGQTLKSGKTYEKALSLIPLMKAEEKYFFANLLATYRVPKTKDFRFDQSWRGKFCKQANTIAQTMSAPSAEAKLLRANILRYASREDLDNVDAGEIKTAETQRLDDKFAECRDALVAPLADEIANNRETIRTLLEAEAFDKAIELADQNIALISDKYGKNSLRLVPERSFKFEAYTRLGKTEPSEKLKAAEELEQINNIIDSLPAFPNLERQNTKTFNDNQSRIKRTLMAFDAAMGWQPPNRDAEIKAEVIRFKLDLKMFSGPDAFSFTTESLADRFKKTLQRARSQPSEH